jgi:hypothetical protein
MPGPISPDPALGAGAFRPNKYSKRDYEVFAHMLKRCKPFTTADNKDPANQAWAAVVSATAELFHEDNPRFDMLTFMKRIHEHETVSLESRLLRIAMTD